MGGWQRIGIITSVLWFFIGGFIGNNSAIDQAGKQTSAQVDICVSRAKNRLSENAP